MRLFASRGLDAVILEVGLGGRLDAVNIIDTDCAIVTSIDIDHTEYLGDTREKIGFEKAGIFRPDTPAICGDPSPPQSLIDHAAGDRRRFVAGRPRFPLRSARRQRAPAMELHRPDAAALGAGLSGVARRESADQYVGGAGRARSAARADSRCPRRISGSVWRTSNCRGASRWCRASRKSSSMSRHNPHAAAVLAQNLGNMGFFPYTYAVFGAMADKDIAGVVEHLKGEIDHWNVTALPTPRGGLCQRRLKAFCAMPASTTAPTAALRNSTIRPTLFKMR